MVRKRKYIERIFSAPQAQIASTEYSKDISEGIGESHSWGKVFFTLPSASGHTETVVKLINRAVKNNKPLFIASFIVSYHAIVDHLVEAAQKLKGKIFLITAIDRNEVRKITLDSSITSSTERSHFSALEKLSRAGVRIRNYSEGHWKMLIVGDEIGFITSANITREAYEENPEVGLIFHDRTILQSLQSLFNTVWFNFCTKELVKRKTIDLEVPDNVKLADNILTKSSGGEIELWMTLGHTRFKGVILNALEEARSNIDILCYSITNKEIIAKLNRKAQQGIKIRIVLPVIHSMKEATKQKIAALDEAIETRYFVQTHAKTILVDQKRVLVSTGNLDKHLNQDRSLDLAISSIQGKTINELSSLFEFVFKHGTPEKKTEIEAKWEDYRRIDLHVDSPLKIAPWIDLPLQAFVSILREGEIVLHPTDWQEKSILILHSKKAGLRDNFFALEETETGFYFQRIPYISTIARRAESIRCQELEIHFHWSESEVEEDILV
ncbi:MAG: phosphatidylserine/phosphatidylglycerophosphate/cardiolipin synthase family protein [Candidatus Heimdallarchaeota archaeon]